MTQKKYVLLLSALLSVSLLMMSACSNDGNNIANPAPGANEGTATINKTGMPIANEPVHLKGLVAKYELVRDWNEHKGLKDYEAKSNDIIDWDSVPQNTFEERRNLLFASNDLPDFVMRAMMSPQLIS
ncbi:hypothetical protein GNF85_17480, partial [Clostridium perfringens]